MLTPQMARFYAPIQTFEGKQLSVNLLDNPEDFYMHNRRYSTSVILQFVYGRRVPICITLSIYTMVMAGDCEEVKMVFEVLARFTSFRRPGSYMVDTFPSLASNPFFNWFSNWKRDGKEIHKADTKVFMTFLRRMQEDIETGTAKHCFGKELLQADLAEHELEELDAAYIMYGRRCFSKSL
jgi:hypothetical protein